VCEFFRRLSPPEARKGTPCQRPFPPEVLAAARAAAEDSPVRYAAGDTSVTDEEALAYRNLIRALKLSEVRSPVIELIDRAGSPGNYRTV
jgi:hypothetical protein